MHAISLAWTSPGPLLQERVVTKVQHFEDEPVLFEYCKASHYCHSGGRIAFEPVAVTAAVAFAVCDSTRAFSSMPPSSSVTTS